MTFFRHLPDFQKGASHKLYPNFSKEPILFHHKIKIEGTVISRKVWRRLGIRTIGQLTSENFEFLQYNRFTTKFGNDINFLEYYGMIKAIKKYKESLHLKDEPSPNRTEAKSYPILQSERKGTKAIRNILLQNIRLLPKAVAKWNNTFLGLDWPAIYSSLKNSTSDTRFKWFQYRILHRVLTTNDYLYKTKVIDSDRCTCCKTEKETISHLLWDCAYPFGSSFQNGSQRIHLMYVLSVLRSNWLFLA